MTPFQRTHYPNGKLAVWVSALFEVVVCIIIFALLSVTESNAIEVKRKITQYSHRFWTLDDGLPHNTIRSILQTREGFLWLATFEGLVRFDGTNFTYYDRKNTPAIKNNGIISLAESGDGSLWIGTNGGGLVRYKNGEFISYTALQGLTSNYIYALCSTKEGDLWVGTNGSGVMVLSPQQDSLVVKHRFNELNGLLSPYISSIIQSKNGNIWVSTSGGGIHSFNSSSGNFTPIPSTNNAYNPFVNTITEATTGELWLGTENGVYLYHPQKGFQKRLGIEDGLLDLSIRLVYEDQDSTLWIGSYGGALSRFRNGKIDSFLTDDGLTSKSVLSALEDREGNLWIGTNGGLNQFSTGKFQAITRKEGLADNYARCVLQTKDGAMWIGSESGLTRIQGDDYRVFTKKDGLKSDYVFSLFEQEDGTLWAGTNGGIAILRNDKISTLTTEDGLSHSRVNAILEDREGRFWIGTNSGLNLYNNSQFLLLGKSFGLDNAFVCALFEDSYGRIWIGSSLGLHQFEKGELKSIVPNNGLSTNTVFCFFEDEEKNVWVGTSNGLWKFTDGARVAALTMQDGLPEGNIFRILNDDLGYYWLSNGKGIYRVAVKDLNEYIAKRLSSIPMSFFNRSDGMKSSQCNGVSQPAGWRTQNGQLWFPTTMGVSYVNPLNLKINHLPPPLMINNLVINYDAIQLPAERLSKLSLTPGKERFEFHYSALSFLAPEKVRFKYRLENFDSDWIDAGTRRVAYYTNLPPGDYRFIVIACNNDGIWNDSGAYFEFSLEPYFYQTKWFLLFSVVGLILSGIAVNGFRVSRLKKREAFLEKTVQERTLELKLEQEKTLLTLKELEISQRETEQQRKIAEEANQMKSELLEIAAGDLRDPLNSIQQFSDLLLEDKVQPQMKSQFLKLIRDSAYRMSTIITDILNANAVETGSLKINFRPIGLKKLVELTALKYQMELSSNSQILDIDARTEGVVKGDEDRLKEIIQNLLSNAMKFSPPNTLIRIILYEENNKIRMEFHDEGQGLTQEDLERLFLKFQKLSPKPADGGRSVGIGLSIVKRLVEMQNGKITAQSKGKNRGSSFIVEFPKYLNSPA